MEEGTLFELHAVRHALDDVAEAVAAVGGGRGPLPAGRTRDLLEAIGLDALKRGREVTEEIRALFGHAAAA